MHETFRTVFSPAPAPFRLSHSDQLLLIGSCFTEQIGSRLEQAKFQLLRNPFGIVYNPVSIGNCIERLLAGNRFFTEADLVQQGDLWHSWDHHGRFSSPDKQTTLQSINTAYAEAVQFLEKAGVVLLTLGTADVFMLGDSGRVVANNHKAPAAWFSQRRLSVEETIQALLPPLTELRARQPGLKLVLTVSPVRHLRLGMVENQRSKAVLLLACEALVRLLPDAWYFPAYELLLDDLRDYRFYATDMVHPAEQAVHYIWEAFSTACFSMETRELISKIKKITSGVEHRPLHPGTAGYAAFKTALLENIKKLEEQYPFLGFEEERGKIDSAQI